MLEMYYKTIFNCSFNYLHISVISFVKKERLQKISKPSVSFFLSYSWYPSAKSTSSDREDNRHIYIVLYIHTHIHMQLCERTKMFLIFCGVLVDVLFCVVFVLTTKTVLFEIGSFLELKIQTNPSSIRPFQVRLAAFVFVAVVVSAVILFFPQLKFSTSFFFFWQIDNVIEGEMARLSNRGLTQELGLDGWMVRCSNGLLSQDNA